MKRNTAYYDVSCTLMACAACGCVEPFDLKTEIFDDLLAVDAVITDEIKHQEISLTRTFRFEADGPKPENNATVRMLEVGGAEIFFREQTPGKYVSSSEFAVEQGKSYQLKITTENGRSYSSREVGTPQDTQLDEIYAERIVNDVDIDGVAIYADSFDPTGNSLYYRYEYQEAYKIVPPFTRQDSLYSVSDEYPDCEVAFALKNPYAHRGVLCFGSNEASNKIILTTTTGLTEDRVSRFLVRFLEQDNPIIGQRYSVLVNQYVVNYEAYLFYDVLKSFSDPESLFSETQSGFIEGNISSDDNLNEKVIGYFDVSTISTTRIFFNYEDFYNFGDKRPYFFPCRVKKPANPLFQIFGPGCNLPSFVQSYDYIYAGPNNDPRFDEGPYDFVRRRCDDCREFASEEAPDFWIE